MTTRKWNQFESTEHLYLNLKLALWDKLYKSKKHKAYYLFAVLFSGYNLNTIRYRVHDNSLDRIWEKRHPDEMDDDNIDIYFLEDDKGKFFIVLLYNPFYQERERALLDIIPVKTNDYKMTQIYPGPAKPNLKTIIHKKPTSREARWGE